MSTTASSPDPRSESEVGHAAIGEFGVKEGLTPQRRVENDQYAAMLKRLINAYGHRVGHADPYDLEEMLDVLSALQAQIGYAVRKLRHRGYSWGDIAEATRVTRQAAQQRWGA